VTRAPAAAALAVLFIAAAAPPKPGWRAFADCAAAYGANAGMGDPDRSPSMTAQISEVAGDYRKAAAARLRQTQKVSAATAERRVGARIGERSAVFAAQPRAAVEKVIEACPQTEDAG
jgi:hypothetical protein